VIQYALRSIAVVMVLVFALAGCQTMTGKSAGENVNDASITAAVKSKLAAEKVSTLTRIDVATN